MSNNGNKYLAAHAEMYNAQEIARIEIKEKSNEEISNVFREERKEWNDRLTALFELLDFNNLKENGVTQLIDLQAKMLSYRQELNDEVRATFSDISKSNASKSKLEQEKILFYATDFSLKITNVNQIKSLIEGHLRENIRESQIYQIHMEFLNECIKSLDNLGYSVKNTIEILNINGAK